MSVMTFKDMIEAILELKGKTTDYEKRLNDIHSMLTIHKEINGAEMKKKENENTDKVKHLKDKIMKLEYTNQVMEQQLKKNITEFGTYKSQITQQRETLLNLEKSYFTDLVSFKENFTELHERLKDYEIKWEYRLDLLEEFQKQTSEKFHQLQEQIQQLKEIRYHKENGKIDFPKSLRDIHLELNSFKDEMNNIKSQVKRLERESIYDEIIQQISDKFSEDKDKILMEIVRLEQYKKKIDTEISGFKTQLGTSLTKLEKLDVSKMVMIRQNEQPLNSGFIVDDILAQTTEKFFEVKKELDNHLKEITIQKDNFKLHESKMQSKFVPLEIQMNYILTHFTTETDALNNRMSNNETKVEDLVARVTVHDEILQGTQLLSLIDI